MLMTATKYVLSGKINRTIKDGSRPVLPAPDLDGSHTTTLGKESVMDTSFVDKSSATSTPTSPERRVAVPTSVYRYYDSRDILLYVGITSRGIKRNREHNTTKEWWQFVARQEVEHYGSQEHASSREQGLIRKFRPPFNTRHNPSHEQDRAAYLTFPSTAKPIDWREWVKENLPKSRRISLLAKPLGDCLLLVSQPADSVVVDYMDIATKAPNFRLGVAGRGGQVTMISRSKSILSIRIEPVNNAIGFRNGHVLFTMSNVTSEVPRLRIKRIDAVLHPDHRS
jgi:predicted GIY-YIG superfamily endonuclease